MNHLVRTDDTKTHLTKIAATLAGTAIVIGGMTACGTNANNDNSAPSTESANTERNAGQVQTQSKPGLNFIPGLLGVDRGTGANIKSDQTNYPIRTTASPGQQDHNDIFLTGEDVQLKVYVTYSPGMAMGPYRHANVEGHWKGFNIDTSVNVVNNTKTITDPSGSKNSLTIRFSEDESGTSPKGLGSIIIDLLPSTNFGTFNKADLQGANLGPNGFSGGNFMRTNFHNANLAGANLSGGEYRFVGFVNANLRGANLSGARLNPASLLNADLTGADLRGADLTGSNLKGAKLDGIITDSKTKLPK